jgi:HTH-type transcriptional regulator, cell division transcriptional repressor
MDSNDDWYGPETATFGDRLAAAREKTGMNQKDLTKRLGIKLSTLRSWEEDWAEPRANKLQMLSGLLNVSLTWLLTGEGDGITGPDDDLALPADVNEILLQMRDVRTQMTRLADKLSLLEKRLRMKLQEDQK